MLASCFPPVSRLCPNAKFYHYADMSVVSIFSSKHHQKKEGKRICNNMHYFLNIRLISFCCSSVLGTDIYENEVIQRANTKTTSAVLYWQCNLHTHGYTQTIIFCHRVMIGFVLWCFPASLALVLQYLQGTGAGGRV